MRLKHIHMKSLRFSRAVTIGAVVIVIAGTFLINPIAKAFLHTNLIRIGLTDAPARNNAAARPATMHGKQNEENSVDEPQLAPAVVFKDGDGKTIDIAEQKGKVLFINFWATWCPPCIRELPSINKLRSQFDEKDILFLMVDVDDNYMKSSKYIRDNNYDLAVYTPAGPIPSDFLSGSIPTTVVIDKEGQVVIRQEGSADYMSPEIVEFFKELINK